MHTKGQLDWVYSSPGWVSVGSHGGYSSSTDFFIFWFHLASREDEQESVRGGGPAATDGLDPEEEATAEAAAATIQ